MQYDSIKYVASYIALYNLKRLFKWISYTTNRKWRDRKNGKNVGKIKSEFCV